nr:hypothetical protein CFP56_11509 [Quercus suber]
MRSRQLKAVVVLYPIVVRQSVTYGVSYTTYPASSRTWAILDLLGPGHLGVIGLRESTGEHQASAIAGSPVKKFDSLQESLEILESSSGRRYLADGERPLLCRRTLAPQSDDHDKLVEAEAMYMRALSGYEKAPGADHTSMLSSVICHSHLRIEQNRLEEAKALYTRARTAYEKMSSWLRPYVHSLERSLSDNIGASKTDTDVSESPEIAAKQQHNAMDVPATTVA